MATHLSTDELLKNLELQLLDPAFRRDTSRVMELLTDDFLEVGTRGRRYDLIQIVREMSRGRPNSVVVKDWETREIFPTVMLCTYRTVSTSGREVFRSSIWVRATDGRWLMSFHQGTPVPDAWAGLG
ncbi:MAG TPA: DUF4440 domain-containing protein [Acidimicrobiia bacterium]